MGADLGWAREAEPGESGQMQRRTVARDRGVLQDEWDSE